MLVERRVVGEMAIFSDYHHCDGRHTRYPIRSSASFRHPRPTGYPTLVAYNAQRLPSSSTANPSHSLVTIDTRPILQTNSRAQTNPATTPVPRLRLSTPHSSMDGREETTPLIPLIHSLPSSPSLLQWLVSLDQHASARISESPSPHPLVDMFLAFFCLLFSYFALAFYIPLDLIFSPTPKYTICAAVTVVVVSVLKHAFGRHRPDSTLMGARLWTLSFEKLAENSSFPSGDTAQSAVAAVTLYWTWQLNAAPAVAALVLLVGLVGLGRVFFARHHVADVCVGGLLGAGVSSACMTFMAT